MPALLERLHALRGAFGASATREKLELLAELARARWSRAEAVAAWHDELLFLAAFPDSVPLQRAALGELARIGTLVGALPARERNQLADSGLAGTETSHTFMFGAARWLARNRESLAIAWEREADAERLDSLLRLTLTSAESDRFDSGEVGTREWMGEAAERLKGGAAPWLLAQAPADDASREAVAWRALYDEAEVPLRWSIGASPWSASRDRIGAGHAVVRTAFRRAPADPIALISTPLKGIVRARGADAARWHDASLGALLSRAREVFPTIYANDREIFLAPLGEGATLCVLGVAPEDRSALEANYGYVIFANGVPIGYGGVTPLGAQANTGANIFESFRRSEAAFLFAQSLRAFRTLFGVTRFVVNPYQIGAGNEEAIASGAYWFYDRLGFRPVEPRVAALAKREREAIARDHAHRSTQRTLRALASGDVVLTLPGAEHEDPIPERILVSAGRLATAALSAVPAGGRAQWIEAEAQALLLRCTGTRRALTRAERLGTRHLIPILVPLLPRISRMKPAERAALWQLVALKGAPQERGFARAAVHFDALWREIDDIES